MRKSIISLIAIFAIGFVLGFFIRPVLAYTPVNVEVNDKLVQFPDQGAYIDKVSSRTYVPIRFVAEYFGAKVNWNQDTKTATINTVNPENKIELIVGNPVMMFNGTPYHQQMDAPPQIEKKRVMIPVRYVSEVIGKYVLYDQHNRLVRISDKPFIATDELSAEQIKRLQSYPFALERSVGGMEPPTVDPGDGFGEFWKVPTHHTSHLKTQFDVCLDGIDYFHLTQNNQRFITDKELIAGVSGDCNYIIRGIVQTTYPDGSITEKDVEFGMGWGMIGNGQPDYWQTDTLSPRTIELSKERRVE